MREQCDTHKRGDYFDGMWICADCYATLDSRPKKYRIGGELGVQEIAWQAKIATCDGVTFGKFLSWMVSYLCLRSLGAISKDAARRQCLELLSECGDAFGSRWARWDKSGAQDLVREGIISYWDEGPIVAN